MYAHTICEITHMGDVNMNKSIKANYTSDCSNPTSGLDVSNIISDKNRGLAKSVTRQSQNEIELPRSTYL